MPDDTNIETLAALLGASRNIVLCLGHNGLEFSVGYAFSNKIGEDTFATLNWSPTLGEALMTYAQSEEINSAPGDALLSASVLEAVQRESVLCLAKKRASDSWGVFSMRADWLEISPMHHPIGSSCATLTQVIASIKKSHTARYGMGLSD
jgi:hypothetical protein